MLRISFTVVVVATIQAQREFLRASRMTFPYLDTTSDVLRTEVDPVCIMTNTTPVIISPDRCDLATALALPIFECDIRAH
jgi:hypothetical protein